MSQLTNIWNNKLTAVLVGKTQSNKSQPKAEQTTKSTAKLKFKIYNTSVTKKVVVFLFLIKNYKNFDYTFILILTDTWKSTYLPNQENKQ